MNKVVDLFYDAIEKDEYNKLFQVVLIGFVLITPSMSVIFLYKREWFNQFDFAKLLLIGVTANIVLFMIIYLTLMIGKIPDTWLIVMTKENKKKELNKFTEEINECTESINKITDEVNTIRKKLQRIGKYGNRINIVRVKNKYSVKVDSSVYEVNKIITEVEEKKQKSDEIINMLDANQGKRIIRENIFFTMWIICFFTILMWGNYIKDILQNETTSSREAILMLCANGSMLVLLWVCGRIFNLIRYCREMKIEFRKATGKKYKFYRDSSIRMIVAYIFILIWGGYFLFF